ncbi:hypothetical protein [Cyclobacterium jeungdonense]|uniref:Uncharacterized protein n=1 Tax=Cyclobacterium jeungdonense TaxID=708087 RepID=A0ABT8C3S9_9BACT|nr:hypothetical protein [Cyclobacterium jeungdonense]MDN3687356.1 hypothetical protein [Cyclobacterium jeungdonense]
MKPFVLLACIAFLFTIQVQAQEELETERKTKDKTYHFQEFEALQFEAVSPDEVSTTTFLAKDLNYQKSPVPGPPMGNYRDFKIIKITLPAEIGQKLMDRKDLNEKPASHYLVKRETKPKE